MMTLWFLHSNGAARRDWAYFGNTFFIFCCMSSQGPKEANSLAAAKRRARAIKVAIKRL